MDTNHTRSQARRQFVPLVVLVFCSGCAYYDGGFTYHVDGRIVGADGAPLAQRAILAYFKPFTVNAENERDSFRTDDEGRFAAEFGTGLAWGYPVLFGLIPLGSPPRPPRLDHLYIALQEHSGTWQYQDVRLTKKQQRKAGRINAGDIRMPRR